MSELLRVFLVCMVIGMGVGWLGMEAYRKFKG